MEAHVEAGLAGHEEPLPFAQEGDEAKGHVQPPGRVVRAVVIHGDYNLQVLLARLQDVVAGEVEWVLGVDQLGEGLDQGKEAPRATGDADSPRRRRCCLKHFNLGRLQRGQEEGWEHFSEIVVARHAEVGLPATPAPGPRR